MQFSRLVFLLGAGASVAAGVPDFARVWRDFERQFGLSEQFDHSARGTPGRAAAMLRELIREFRRDGQDFKDFEKLSAHIHREYRRQLDRIEDGDTADAARLHALRAMMRAEYSMRQRFIDLVDVDFDDRPDRGKLVADYRQMLGWPDAGRPLDVFTLNNDLLMEWWLDHARLRYSDGFAGDTMDRDTWSCFGQPSLDLRLYKLHGSINWYRTGAGRPIERWRSQNTLRGFLRRESAERPVLKVPLIWPGVYDEMEELRQWRERYLADAVAQARCLVVAGYKLADDVIRGIVASSLRRWPKGGTRRVLVVCGKNPYEKPLQDFIDDARREEIAVVSTNGEHYGGGYFPHILRHGEFRSQVDQALAGD